VNLAARPGARGGIKPGPDVPRLYYFLCCGRASHARADCFSFFLRGSSEIYSAQEGPSVAMFHRLN
jgi:hypothetical protein